MNIFYRFVIIVYFFSASYGFAQTNSNNDFQFWTGENKIKKISDAFSLGLDSEWRFLNDAKKLSYIHEQLSLIYSPFPWIKIIPSYRQVWEKNIHSKWHPSYNPLIDITFLGHRKNLEISDRNRIQYSISSNNPNIIIYRNLIKISYIMKKRNFTFIPYISDEFFFPENRGYNQNRLSTGLIIKFLDLLSCDLLYRRRFFKLSNENWIQQNILGIFFTLYL
ncbi:MAG: hypothetical protein Tsb0015_03120 [Simkaniaceae bacterium]